ncbi:hypothetical protein COY25_02765 [Candidatus Uhrbacteria bacterium CG_4_10_14_0_2_um_filter_41_7]|uniref:GtrA/DPMS transmembrane domain-containing protein n=1 Tax=Candidatus Uhrbacteria bacterium CG_4_9_14_3_um_filter_41_35 TaxID=1975034 RepID=A0A2M7XF39_9BACT|nr:MAG: hypothetical protein COV92_02835 [Candidatus Uhrbacteria bacterium CG11_big_fil_rev_8_21_14_0_20_41_9]PIZ53950.1 MAG: hypothetical protein COY25_02765 [Candidatus Uhrbacteria bacterium CG_4_10_14_0_2_um_filter_41_7]PJA46497.1 MAG: hypothetical protein CO173_01905 [Candidatus Uhrbacteria bacterium CG_4_9_14_3_um_filter_41_35]
MLIKLLKNPRVQHHGNRFAKFVTVGLVSACFDLGILTFLVEVFSFNLYFANSISFFVAVNVSYNLNKNWTFNSVSTSKPRQIYKFFTIAIIGFMFNQTSLFILTNLGIWYVFAKIMMVSMVAIWNYSANYLWTFSTREKYEKTIHNNSSF